MSLLGDDEGFSAVLGAMVMLGLALVAFTTYQTALAPALEARSEAEQMADAGDRLSEWVAGASLAEADRQPHPTSVSLPLSAPSPPFAGSPSAGTVSFTPDTGEVSLSARNLSASHVNGTPVAETEETWRPVDGGSVDDIARVEDFRLRIDGIDSDRTGESVTVNVTDDGGDHVGALRLAVVDPGGNGQGGGQGFEVVVTTWDAAGTVLFDQPILISSTTHDSHSDPIAPYWVNLLNPDYRFDRVLASAEPPFSVELAREGLDADYTIDYARTATGGSGSGGLLHEGYARSIAAGRLVFEARADEADDQRLAVEHGAVVRAQDEGAVFARSPAFSATTVDHEVVVSFAWPALSGAPDARSTQGSLDLRATPSGQYAIRGQATNLTVNVTTAHPALWEQLFTERLTDAGLSVGDGFETANGTNWARVDVWGLLAPDPSSDRYDVRTDLRAVDTEVRLGT